MDAKTIRRIKLMADYDCFPLWDLGDAGPANLDTADLPIPVDLLLDLRAWTRRYDDTLDRADLMNSGFPSPEDHAEFAKTGSKLALWLAKSLGSSWSVVYFNNATGAKELLSQDHAHAT